MTLREKVATETPAQTFARWLSDNQTWIGVFENHDLGHHDTGRRVSFPFDISTLHTAKVGVTRATDHKTIGQGWRYILVVQCHTAEDAVAALAGEAGVVH